MKTTHKIIGTMIIFFMAVLTFTACSPEDGKDGLDGEQGPIGNANVKAFSLTVKKEDWSQNLHYGQSNVFRYYELTADKLGNETMFDVFNAGGAVLIYARSYDSDQLLPTAFSYNNIGVKLNVHISRNELTISKTTNGWDNLSITENELPSEIEYKIILIPKNISVNSRLRNIDYSELSYKEVCDMFNISE